MTPSYDELRRIAEAATPGPWEFYDTNEGLWGVRSPHVNPPIVETDESLLWEDENLEYRTVAKEIHEHESIDMKFIATFNPKTVLELLDRIKELEGCDEIFPKK